MISIAFDKRNHPADLIRQLSGVAEKLPFATSLAINRTAQKVRRSIVEEMEQSFDRPTPYTLRSLYIQPSTKDNLEAVIQFKDKSVDGGKSTPASKYLSPAVFAENRRAKSHERKLRDAGILPSNMFLAPTRSAGGILNSFGNINRSVIKELLSDLGTRKPAKSENQKLAASLTAGFFAHEKIVNFRILSDRLENQFQFDHTKQTKNCQKQSIRMDFRNQVKTAHCLFNTNAHHRPRHICYYFIP